jgi:replicative DNA helicase
VSVPRAEIALIGSLLIDPDAADEVAAVVGAEDFASARWREVYAAVTALRLAGRRRRLRDRLRRARRGAGRSRGSRTTT